MRSVWFDLLMESSHPDQSESSVPSVWLELQNPGAAKDCRDYFLQSHHLQVGLKLDLAHGHPASQSLKCNYNLHFPFILRKSKIDFNKAFLKIYSMNITSSLGKTKKNVPMFKCIWKTACITVSDSQFIQLLNKYSFIFPYASDTVPGTKTRQWNQSLKSFVLEEEINIK